MRYDDDLATLRRRHAELADRAGDGPPDHAAGGHTALVVTTTAGSYPTLAPVFYAVQRVSPGGAEAEGAAPTFTTYGATFYALNLGLAVPPIGTRVLATLDSGRYCFRYD